MRELTLHANGTPIVLFKVMTENSFIFSLSWVVRLFFRWALPRSIVAAGSLILIIGARLSRFTLISLRFGLVIFRFSWFRFWVTHWSSVFISICRLLLFLHGIVVYKLLIQDRTHIHVPHCVVDWYLMKYFTVWQSFIVVLIGKLTKRFAISKWVCTATSVLTNCSGRIYIFICA